MGLEKGGQVVCLDVEVALDFVQGRLGEKEIEVLEEHVDRCEPCRLVLAEATRAFRERETTAAAPSPARVAFTRLAPGDTLSGRYRILRFIARGGMGEVYEAEDSILNTRLALKTLAATISDDPAAIRRLKQEVNLARRITHPNVCRIFDLGVHQQQPSSAAMPGQLFITMELVAGKSLGQFLRQRKGGRLTAAEAVPIVRAMVAALGAAHRAHVVHRDFKSDNVMLAPEEGGPDRVVVMDFGLARAALAGESSSVDGQALAGTLPYMSPEQLQGKAVGPATDIYALGVVIFEMLTGQLPFKDEPPLAAAWRRVAEPPPPLGSLVSGLDPGWDRLVSACLEREPGSRPAADDVSQLLAPLEVGAHGASPVPMSPSVTAKVNRGFWARSRQYAFGASALLALVAVAGLVRKPARSVPVAASPPPSAVMPLGPSIEINHPIAQSAATDEPAVERTEATPSSMAPMPAPAPMENAPHLGKAPLRGGTAVKRSGKSRGPAPRPTSPMQELAVVRVPPLAETSPPGAPSTSAEAPSGSGDEAGTAKAGPRSQDPNDGFIPIK